MADEVYSIAILIDELRHEDMQLRLNSMRRLGTIAVALGEERTRNELMPFLNDSIDDEDEVLLVLAEELGNFVNAVGGKNFAYTLLVPLETLCIVEESTVRDKAVESICKITLAMSEEHVSEHFVPLVDRLAKRDWFTSRISACGLFSVGYHKLQVPSRVALRTLFEALCKDDTPMVRRAAAKNISGFVAVVEPDLVQAQLFPLFKHLAKDEQDSVRLLAVENCVSFIKVLPVSFNVSEILPIVMTLAADKSWRVRWSVAENICSLCERFGKDITKEYFVEVFSRFLCDMEAEVRAAAAFKATAMANLIAWDSETTVVDSLMPAIKKLASDPSEHVKSALASVIMDMAPVLGRDNSISHLLPLFLQFLKDDSAEVRLNIISKLEEVNKVIGIELLSQSLLPAIVQLAEDRQWRIRLAIIEYMPLLAKQLGQEFFVDKLVSHCISWLSDSVYSIREAAASNLHKLTLVFGSEWSKVQLIPAVVTIYQNSNYLYRLTALSCVKVLSTTLESAVVQEGLLPMVLHAASDPVPNIRFNVAKTLQFVAPKLQKEVVNTKVKPCLISLGNDTDYDVKYFAGVALAAC